MKMHTLHVHKAMASFALYKYPKAKGLFHQLTTAEY